MSSEHHAVLSRIKTVSDMVEAFRNEERCRYLLERMVWPRGRICPACGFRESIALAGRDTGAKARPGLYQCSNGACRHQFTVTTHTPLHTTKLPLRIWLTAMWLFPILQVALGSRHGRGERTGHGGVFTVIPYLLGNLPLSNRAVVVNAGLQERVQRCYWYGLSVTALFGSMFNPQNRGRTITGCFLTTLGHWPSRWPADHVPSFRRSPDIFQIMAEYGARIEIDKHEPRYGALERRRQAQPCDLFPHGG